jgi:hypothetical protein
VDFLVLAAFFAVIVVVSVVLGLQAAISTIPTLPCLF